MKKQNGITLVALVVTIIVLLILAGVSLNLIAGSNGILRRATTAVKTTNEKASQEKLQLAMAELLMDYYAGGMEEATFADYLKAHGVYNLPSGEMFSFEVNDDNTMRIEYYNKEENDMPDMEFSFDLTTNEIVIEASGGEIKPGRKKSTITYDANGGTGNVPASKKVLQGTNVKVDTTTTLTKQGYNFLGWALSNSATTVIANFEMPENDVTLYAIWTPISYTVVYNGNGATGGSTASSTHTYGITKNLTENGFTKTCHTFAGWATSSDGAKVYNNSQSVSNLTTTNGGTVNLYAVWTVSHNYINMDLKDCSSAVQTAYRLKENNYNTEPGYHNTDILGLKLDVGDMVYVPKDLSYGGYVMQKGYYKVTGSYNGHGQPTEFVGETFYVRVCTGCGQSQD